MNKQILFILIVFLSQNYIAQDAKFDSLVEAGINQIYNIKFDDAESTFQTLQLEYPKHPAGKFFSAMILWWEITLDKKNESYDDLFEEKMEGVVDFCEDRLDENDKNVDAIFFKGGALGFKGRLYALRKQWFDAALDGKEALPLVNEAYQIDPTNEDVKLGFGIYNYFAEAIPEKYPFVKPAMMFFPGGDKAKGIKQLEAAAEKAKYAGVESQFFLMTLYYQFEQNYKKAFPYAETLHENFPDNPIFEKYLGRIIVKKGNYSKASKVFSSINNKCGKKLKGYSKNLKREATYYIANNYKMTGNIKEAIKYFEECEALSKIIDKNADETSGFLINAVLYLGMLYDQADMRADAINNYKEVLKYRKYGNSQKNAKKYLKKAYRK
ncbi:MAG: tetratricopeptide repeat protein [Melioribacteraceae bacterium]